MKITLGVILMCAGIVLFPSCKKKKNSSIIPAISFVELGPESVKAGSSEDTAYLTFLVADGDADLGNDQSGINYDVFVRDTRDTLISKYFFPEIPGEIRDPSQGMKGTCTITMLAAFLLPRADSLHMATGDTLTYEVYVKDRAGHESNHIITTPLILVL